MYRKVLTFIGSLGLMLVLGSCATNNGNSYLKNHPNALLKMPSGTPVTDLNSSTVPKTEFDKARTKLEMSIIHQTPTPIWIPPVMAKVLIMPYVDQSGVLHSYQYVFTQLAQGHWLMGKYLSNANQVMTEHPLAATVPYQPKVMKPLSSQAGMPITPGVVGNNNANEENNNANENNANKGFFNGGAPKKTIDTNVPTGSNDNNQQYFNNTLNSMKQGG